MSYLIGHYAELGWVALKALLLFAVAVVGLRLSQRRMLAELNVFDLVVTVAVGAIVGRTATSSTTSLATGAVALITLLVAHRIVTGLHRRGWLGGLLDRRPLILIVDGRLQPEGLGSAGLTRRDVYRMLRQSGEGDLAALQYVLYEDGGRLTMVRTDQQCGEAVRAGLAEAGIDTGR
ncbi:DUF421 domain-containing protein [Mycolicibacterium sphagni]|uniref:YetF C-terminal domain-containing protein n=1 Tax=Mycolicibacterium sphagni TaxID=1786 RepID=A0A255DDI6_9MYCO|nr:YetF domain-containing protein [Mycolicibacterium sphagni]OYN77488.1 hypothetical protein CG716_18330 [Mycolicibacterium sphagni]